MMISLYPSLLETTPELVDYSWPELVSFLTEEPLVVQSKRDAPLWSPAHIKGTRQNDNVQEISCLVLDFDQLEYPDGPPIGEEDALELLAAIPYAHVVYTTHSHCPPKIYKFRVVIPLSNPVPAASWESFWAFASQTFPLADPQCKDLSRAYFVPSCPKSELEFAFSYYRDGPTFEVPEDLEFQPPPLEQIEKLTQKAFMSFAKRSLSKVPDLGDRLLSIANGEPFAEPGERDVVIFRLSVLLANQFPKHKPHSIARFFARSLDQMKHQPDCPTVQDVEYKLKRAQEALWEERSRAEHNQENRRLLRLKRLSVTAELNPTGQRNVLRHTNG